MTDQERMDAFFGGGSVKPGGTGSKIQLYNLVIPIEVLY